MLFAFQLGRWLPDDKTAGSDPSWPFRSRSGGSLHDGEHTPDYVRVNARRRALVFSKHHDRYRPEMTAAQAIVDYGFGREQQVEQREFGLQSTVSRSQQREVKLRQTTDVHRLADLHCRKQVASLAP